MRRELDSVNEMHAEILGSSREYRSRETTVDAGFLEIVLERHPSSLFAGRRMVSEVTTASSAQSCSYYTSGTPSLSPD